MNEQLRRDFEEWARGAFDLRRLGGSDRYSSHYTHAAWAAWQGCVCADARRLEWLARSCENLRAEPDGAWYAVGWSDASSKPTLRELIDYHMDLDRAMSPHTLEEEVMPPPRGNLPGLYLDSGEFVPAEELK